MAFAQGDVSLGKAVMLNELQNECCGQNTQILNRKADIFPVNTSLSTKRLTFGARVFSEYCLYYILLLDNAYRFGRSGDFVPRKRDLPRNVVKVTERNSDKRQNTKNNVVD